MRGLGATARGRTQFYSRIHIKKKSRDPPREKARSGQGAGRERARSALSDPMPPGMPSKKIVRIKNRHRHRPKRHGTRDDKRI